MGKVLSLVIFIFSLTSCGLISKKPLKTYVQTPKAQKQKQFVSKKELSKIDQRIAKMQKRDLISKKNRYKLPKPLTADSLYAEVIKSYRLGNGSSLEFYQEALLKRFPQSVHSDNALLLVGKYQYKKSGYAQSLKYFQAIIKDHKGANKRPAALLMKAKAYTELNLKELAINTLKKLRKEYPGSPEYFQAEAEIKILMRM